MFQPRNQRRNKKNTWSQMKNENTIVQNLWNGAKVVLRWKVIAIQAYLKKKKKSNKHPNLTHKGGKTKNKIRPKP